MNAIEAIKFYFSKCECGKRFTLQYDGSGYWDGYLCAGYKCQYCDKKEMGEPDFKKPSPEWGVLND